MFRLRLPYVPGWLSRPWLSAEAIARREAAKQDIERGDVVEAADLDDAIGRERARRLIHPTPEERVADNVTWLRRSYPAEVAAIEREAGPGSGGAVLLDLQGSASAPSSRPPKPPKPPKDREYA